MPWYYRDFALQSNGSMTFSGFPDGVLHMALANEVSHTVPPEVPYLAGVPERYHYGMDIATAMFAKTFGLTAADLTVRFLPTLFVVMTILSIFIFSRVWFGSPYVAILSTVLVYFGEDFSYIPGLIRDPNGLWNEDFFNSGTITALYWVNPFLPALGVFFVAIFCLAKAYEGRSTSWGFWAAVLTAALLNLKVFLYGEVIASFAISGGLYLVYARDSRLIKLFLAVLVVSVPLYVFSWWGIDVTATQSVQLDPWTNVIPSAINQIGAASTAIGQTVLNMYSTHIVSVPGLAALLFVIIPLYIIGSFGVRILAIPQLIRELFQPQSTTALRHCLVVYALLGPLVTLTWTVVARGYDPVSQYDNTTWFISQGKYIISIFALEALLVIARGRPRWLQGTLVAVMLLLSAPSAVRYVVYLSNPSTPGYIFTPS